MRADRERVLELLDEAFRAKPPRGAPVANRGEEFEVHDPEMHRGVDWRRIDRNSFRDCEQLNYLTPLGFLLYVAGFLRCAIESLDDDVWLDKAGVVCEHLALDPDGLLTSHREKQFRVLNGRQVAAVTSALLLLEREGFLQATAALDSWWRGHASMP